MLRLNRAGVLVVDAGDESAVSDCAALKAQSEVVGDIVYLRGE